MKNSFPTRQVHLDFHTSPLIPGVGSAFDGKEFAATLQAARVESITVFAKCHHGVCYYPTKVGTPHPHLSGDLTGAMIAAAHSVGVRAPVYITAGWSDLDAETHPEWIARDKHGNPRANAYDFNATADMPKPETSWRNMCLNDGSYARHIYAITEEVCDRYADLDGLFYDICFADAACYCDECIAGMKAAGYDPEREEDAKRYHKEKHIAFMKKCGEILHKKHPEATIFFNGGADPSAKDYHPFATHYELEDLPTAWGGYDKMPIRAKYFASLGKPTIGMTGKFHLEWGEFGGFKTKEALRYEAVSMRLCGVGCSIGDQMLPEGKLDAQTYENIGYVYSYLEKIEPYFAGVSKNRLAVSFSENAEANEGLACILGEKQIGFDLLQTENIGRYDAVILQENSNFSDSDLIAILNYIKNGGKAIFIGDLLRRYPEFAEAAGASVEGGEIFERDYILSLFETEEELPRSPFLTYRPGVVLSKQSGEILAKRLPPAFSRTYGHFCGHKSAPYLGEQNASPAAIQNGNCITLAHDLPLIYREYGCVAHKRLFLALLKRIFTPTVTVGIGSQGRAALLCNETEHRLDLHLTYVSPIRRGKAEIIEDIPTLCDIPVSVKTDREIRSVLLPLSGESLPFSQEDGVCRFVLPRLWLHEVVSLLFY